MRKVYDVSELKGGIAEGCGEVQLPSGEFVTFGGWISPVFLSIYGPQRTYAEMDGSFSEVVLFVKLDEHGRIV